MAQNKENKPKTKWSQLMDATKGSLEYNPTQTFALQVFWVIRSRAAAAEMIKKGFSICGNATMRDTPTTLVYFFRISQDQRLAEKLKEEVKTIGQHPHYKPCFKSMEMGIPQSKVEMKLKAGGINVAPLSWGPDEPMSGHEVELDFDPVVLECTEVYLDDQGFYMHACSRDWMKAYPEIMMASRALVPTTYCLGSPNDKIWDSTLDPSFHAIRFNEENKDLKALCPGVFVHPVQNNNNDKEDDPILFFELDLVIAKEKIEACRDLISSIQKELEVPLMIVLPTNIDRDTKEVNGQNMEVRLMLSLPCSTSTKSKDLSLLRSKCERFEGRIIVFDAENVLNLNQLQNDQVQPFLERFGLKNEKVSILNGRDAEKNDTLAGYPLHPLFGKLIPNDKFIYQLP